MVLKGEKVVLRPLRIDDAPRFVKWFNNPEVHKFLARRKMTLKEEKNWIKSLPKDKENLGLAIDTSKGEHIGSIGLHGINLLDKHATFGIMIGEKSFWSLGYGSEASKLLLNYGFNKLKLHRIELKVYEYNPRAVNVYKKLGFRKEGKMREAVVWKGKYYDSYFMSILDREWKRRNK